MYSTSGTLNIVLPDTSAIMSSSKQKSVLTPSYSPAVTANFMDGNKGSSGLSVLLSIAQYQRIEGQGNELEAILR
jgi:hypothetical protein